MRMQQMKLSYFRFIRKKDEVKSQMKSPLVQERTTCGTPRLILAIVVFMFQACASTGWYDVILPDGRTERITYDLKQCQMIGWKKNYKLNASLDILNKYKGSGGFDFSVEDSRLLDILQTDYGMKFEAICKTYLITNRTDDALFKCEVSNIISALDQSRSLNAILDTIKSEHNAATKKELVLQVLRKYSELSNKDCRKGVSLSKDTLKIVRETAYEDSFTILNGSAVNITWNCKNTPIGFVVKEAKCNGALQPNGISDNITIVRKHPVGKPSNKTEVYSFSIEATNGEDKPLKIETDNFLSKISISKRQKSDVAIKEAKTAIQNSFAGRKDFFVDWIAGTLLYNNGYHREAKQLFEKVAESNPSIRDNPTFLYDMAVVNFKIGEQKKGYEFATMLTSREGYENANNLIAFELLRSDKQPLEFKNVVFSDVDLTAGEVSISPAGELQEKIKLPVKITSDTEVADITGQRKTLSDVQKGTQGTIRYSTGSEGEPEATFITIAPAKSGKAVIK